MLREGSGTQTCKPTLLSVGCQHDVTHSVVVGSPRPHMGYIENQIDGSTNSSKRSFIFGILLQSAVDVGSLASVVAKINRHLDTRQ